MEQTELRIIERGVEMMVSDKFAKVMATSEHRPPVQAKIIQLLGTALGKTLDTIEYPTQWRRFLERKDCPKYMKELVKYNVNVYYPQLPLPKNPFWIALDRIPEDLDAEKEANDGINF